MTKPVYTYLRLNKAKPGHNLMRVVGDYEYLFKLFDLTVLTETEFWTSARNDPDFMHYLAWKDAQRESVRRGKVEQQPRLI